MSKPTKSTMKNRGKCYLCEQEYTCRSIRGHVIGCLLEHYLYDSSSEKADDIFLIEITSQDKLFWLYLEITGRAQLSDLDYYLRDIWLECCSHLSFFAINQYRFSEDFDFNDGLMPDDIDTYIPCKEVFKVDMTFTYEYDFGSTTKLLGKIIGKRKDFLGRKIKLIARNSMPQFLCPCTAFATYICSNCGMFTCDTCYKKFKCACKSSDYLLPVVNSPRMGTCGYTGPA